MDMRETKKSVGLFIAMILSFVFIGSNARGDGDSVVTWAKRYGTGSYDYLSYPSQIAQTVDGGYVISGTSEHDQWHQSFLLKLDAYGSIEWQKEYSALFSNAGVLQTRDAGYFFIATVGCGYYSTCAVATKLDSEGNVSWSKSFGQNIGFYASMFLQVQDGGFILADGQNVVKLDGQGNIQWQKIYGLNTDTYIRAIQQTSDGGYILGGSIGRSLWSAWVMKIDGSGNIEWGKKYASNKNRKADSIQQADDGGYIIAGSDDDSIALWLLKLDMSGNVEWEKTYKGGTGSGDYPRVVRKTNDGGYVIGSTYYVDSGDAIVLKLNADGDLQWEKSYDLGLSEGAASIEQTADNGYVVAGRRVGNDFDIMVMKLDTEGNIAGCMAKNIRVLSPTVAAAAQSTVTDMALSVYNPGISGSSKEVAVSKGTLVIYEICEETEPNIYLNTGSLNFGSVEIKSPSSANVTVSNTGKADLVIDSVSITDAGVGEFSQTNNCATLAVNGSCSISVVFSPLSLGSKNASLHIASNDPDTSTVTVSLAGIGVDTVAPATIASISGKKGDDDWYVSDVTIDLTASDSGSGVKEIHYTIDGSETTVLGSAASFSVTTDASHAINYYAKDNAGNSEAFHSTAIMIDKTPPVIVAAATPAPNANGWNNSDVTVTFTCGDTLSGIASCPAPVTVTTEGAGQVITGEAVDKAGNKASASVTLNIDKTAPSVVSLTAGPSVLWPPNHKMVDVGIGGSASDGDSGTASVVITVTDEMGVYNMTDLNFGSSIQLEAWRDGADMDGRHYTITAVITDKAGNQSTATTTVLVPHDMR